MNRAMLALTIGLALGHAGTAQAGQRASSSQSRDSVSKPQRMAAVIAIEEARASHEGDLLTLLSAARSDPAEDVRVAAVRALGRLERRDVIIDLLPLLTPTTTRAEAANAIGQAFRGPADPAVPFGQLEQAALDGLRIAGASELNSPKPAALGSIARTLGRLPSLQIEQVKAAEEFLRTALDKRVPPTDCAQADVGRGLESLARINRKLTTLDDETLAKLREVAVRITPACASSARNALAALVASQGVDGETLKAVLSADDVETRRIAVLALVGAGSIISDGDRIVAIRALFADQSPMVRYEAVRAWTRRGVATEGCAPLLQALSDRSLVVVLAALDALGDQCRDEQDITDRLASESRTPPPQGRWQREAHAFVALAKRDRARANISMLTFATHSVWQVRMYAARAAAVAGDVAVLERLAADPDDSVAEAALSSLRQRVGEASDAAFVAALKRTNKTVLRNVSARPYQVIRAAAKALDGAKPTRFLIDALSGALTRITAEKCETSRDARLALVERLGVLGSAAQTTVLEPLLEDIDPVVATAAAAVLTAWSGKVVEPNPVKSDPHTVIDGGGSSGERAVFLMDNGRRFEVAFRDDTPLTRSRFTRLARTGYYDGLTFHRVVPNFVVQGGSPGANEYCGDCSFMRDELGLGEHARGTLGISTRGRDTGDAQIFINLVDNARLDHEYTVFARICSERGMDVVDEIQEGDRITRVRLTSSPTPCGGS